MISGLFFVNKYLRVAAEIGSFRDVTKIGIGFNPYLNIVFTNLFIGFKPPPCNKAR